MLGKLGQPFCGSKCCGVPSKDKRFKRRNKRRERQGWRKGVSS